METKAWYQSTSILGSLVTLVALIASIFNYQIDSELQGEIVDIIIGVFGLLGSIYAILGRVNATKLIGKTVIVEPVEVPAEVTEAPIALYSTITDPITPAVVSPTLQPIVAAAVVAYNQVLTNAGVELSAQAK